MSCFALFLLASSTAQASCSLDHCPIQARAESGPRFRVDSRARYSADAASDGSYAELFAGGRVRLADPLELGALVPAILVTRPQDCTAGLGNTVAYVDLAFGRELVVGGGLQVELPTRTDSSLGDGHVLLLPNLHARVPLGALDSRTVAGWGVLPGGAEHDHGADSSEHSHEDEHEHDHDDTPQEVETVQVNPHASSELLWRLDLGWNRQLGQARLRPAVGADVVHELVEAQQTIVAAVPSLEVEVQRTTLGLLAQVPVTTARRQAWRLQLAVSVGLGG